MMEFATGNLRIECSIWILGIKTDNRLILMILVSVTDPTGVGGFSFTNETSSNIRNSTSHFLLNSAPHIATYAWISIVILTLILSFVTFLLLGHLLCFHIFLCKHPLHFNPLVYYEMKPF